MALHKFDPSPAPDESMFIVGGRGFKTWEEVEKFYKLPVSLTDRVMADLHKVFEQSGHNPSDAQWQGLQDLISHLEAMANGAAKSLYYLSPLDPGVGKSQSIIHFVRRLMESEGHKEASVLICLGRLAEIKPMVEQMALKKDDFAILVETADSEKTDERSVLLRELNTAGNHQHRKARVLFTTQQMLTARTKGTKSFGGVDAFHYDGKPRQVRVWDEAILPAREMSINIAQIGALKEPARYDKRLYSALGKLEADIQSAEDQSVFWVPDMESETGVDHNNAIRLYGEEKRSIQEAANDLWLLSGKPVVIEKIGYTNAFIHYDGTLPDDIKPMVICDASGRVRQTYTHWEKGRGDLVILSSGGKNYRNLNVHIWRRGGGKSSWSDENAETLLDGIIRTVNSRPDERFLIVHHKGGKRIGDIPKAIRAKADNPDRLSFVYWGGSDFKATNSFRDVENVILAGTLFYAPETYIARARMSSGIRSEEQVKADVLRKVKDGEHADMILQAVCRGAVRKSVANSCGKCDVYVIADPQTGIPAMLEGKEGAIEIFPGCTAVDWSPVERELNGHVGKSVELIVQHFMDNPGLREKLKSPTARDWLGLDVHDWNSDVLGHRDFEGALAARGIRLTRARGRGGSSFERM
ncbi:hypothetical protein [Mesorhizobium sp. M0227]|uniref:hypothetical protein n=1 Tax=unclassified Mesorhizobium TaxID=325217 RepID=UPI00333964EB